MIPHLPLEDVRVPCLIPESEIRAFMENLRVREAKTVILRLMMVAFAAGELLQSRSEGRSDEVLLLLIKRVAREDNDKRYRHLMDAIVASLSSNKEEKDWLKGFGSVYMTISRAMECVGQLLPDEETTIRMYEEKLKEVRQIKRS
jgi:rubrerythrin